MAPERKVDPVDPEFRAYQKLTGIEKRKLKKLHPWEKKKLRGLALWRAGDSCAEAARKVKMNAKTLQTLTKRDQEGRDDVRAIIQPLAVEIAMESGRQTLEALHAGEVKPTQLPVVFGIATDKLERLNRMQAQAAQSPLGQLMEMLHAGGKVTLEGPGGEAEVTVPHTRRSSEADSRTYDAEKSSLPNRAESGNAG
jgi:hypothetical protein